MNVNTPPTIPVGADAYLEWERWFQQRIGVRAYLRSTYDRTGHNNTADASHYLYQESETFNVTLDVEGEGCLYFVRTNHWHGSPWHYEIDGADHIVAESTTADPLVKLDASVFLPEHAFPSPLTYTYAVTKGGDLSWVPIAFANRLRLAYSRTYYGTGYYIFHQFVRGVGRSRALVPWNEAAPDPDVLALLARAGEDLTADLPAATTLDGVVTVNGRVTIAALRRGATTVRRLALSAPIERALEFGRARLRITWDDRAQPSVDTPIALFFGAGTLHNSDGREWLVKALPMSIRYGGGRVHCACQFPMPFFRSARIELVATSESGSVDDVRWQLRYEPYTGAWNHASYFHATYVDHGEPTFGHDLVFLDTRNAEGSESWTGSFVGTSLVFTERNVLTTLEGDPRFFFDDSETPQAQGTGTEEWGGGGDYWGGRTMTLPLAGHPVGVVDASVAKHPEELIHSAYRFLLADLMPFGKRALIRFEHGGENESLEHYRSVTFWYGLPGASITLTDTLTIGDAKSEAAHEYLSRDATIPYEIESRYEWGPDHLPASLAHPLAAPTDSIDLEFTAPAGRYELWIELQTSAAMFDAAVWAQVNEDVGTDAHRLSYMGSMGYLNGGGAPRRFRFQSCGVRPGAVVFAQGGRQRLRIQPRFGRPHVGRVLLSPGRERRPPSDLTLEPGEILLPSETTRALRAPREVEMFPARTKLARRTTGVSELTLALDPENHGVLLRRTLDYQYAHQRALVSVWHGDDWHEAGVWYLAGSNTVYHSFPFAEGELGPVRPTVITSNRRFRDDEFLLPVELTRGKQRIRLRFEFAPRNPPLLPGMPPAESAWTEIEYRAYCYVIPKVSL